jgi:hypothetical protein
VLDAQMLVLMVLALMVLLVLALMVLALLPAQLVLQILQRIQKYSQGNIVQWI